MNCNLCPRKCNIDRSKKVGFCQQSDQLKVALYSLHAYEEPCISGKNGSGTIFFSGCNLRCNYCQNYEISHLGKGEVITVSRLVEMFKELEQMGAHNINLVTPTHFIEQIVEALKTYTPKIPIVYNSSGYEDVVSLEKLKEYIDIYLVDLKYADNGLAQRLSSASDYFEVATKAILKMRENQPQDVFENGLMKKGVIIRHLVLPNNTQNSIDCLKWIVDNLPTTKISLMSQYTPCYKALESKEINRPLKPIEYSRVLMFARKNNLDGYMQGSGSVGMSYTPKF